MFRAPTLTPKGKYSICVQNDSILLDEGVVGKGDIIIDFNIENEDVYLFIFK